MRAPQVEALVRRNIRELSPYQAARDDVLDGILLDANENPNEVRRDGVPLNRYPDPSQAALLGPLAAWLGIRMTQVVAGNGSDEVLDWIVRVFCDPGRDQVAIAEPTYGMYRVLAETHGVEVWNSPLTASFDFAAEDFLSSVPESVKVLFLCSPNNPTANCLETREIESVCTHWAGIVVVDEAYIEFADSPSLVGRVDEFPNLVVTRTFSKAWGRAAIRLGYAVACEQVCEYFRRIKAPYNLNALTLREGIKAIESVDELSLQIDSLVKERERLRTRLKGMGLQVFPSETNFLLFRCPKARAVCTALMEQGIVVRDRSGLSGLHDCIRVTVGTRLENRLFTDALQAVLASEEVV